MENPSVDFEREGLVNLNGCIEVLGCAYAIRNSYDSPHEWEVRPYFDVYLYSPGQSACELERHPTTVRKQW